MHLHLESNYISLPNKFLHPSSLLVSCFFIQNATESSISDTLLEPLGCTELFRKAEQNLGVDRGKGLK